MRLRYLLLLAPIALGASGVSARGATVGSLCTLSRGDQVADRCFRPPNARFAVKRMPVPAVRPNAAVWRFTHLRLTEIEVRQPEHPVQILYLFGRLPIDVRGFPSLALASPRYVVVGELVGRFPRLAVGLKEAGWVEFDANFRCRKLALSVQSNEPRRVVYLIGRTILRAEACGK